jgi:TPP-dependent pyruvate/acetoin dehydrogenase alpha subunit
MEIFLKLNRADLLKIYEKLYMTRVYDEALKELSERKLWTFYHGIIGEEAVPVGVCSALNSRDYVVPVHRTQMGVMVSRGVNLAKLTAELLGRKDGYCNGISGTHTAVMEQRVLSKTGILCAGLPIAVGVGLSLKLKGSNNVVAVFIGDGASSAGNFHESINMAATWNLPVIFVLENNMYAMYTSARKTLAMEKLAERSHGYDIPGITVDGNNVLTVYETTKNAVERARNGGGPTLIECKTCRILGHHGHGTDEEVGYRSREEVKAWVARDPVHAYQRQLMDKGLEEDMKKIEEQANKEVFDAVKFAESSPFPEAETVIRLSRGLRP